ncbi:MAG: hypothetical protein KIT17_24350 [Rubrivivax sp.]|nr:hypothetical protein [Rubrivivax sp.]
MRHPLPASPAAFDAPAGAAARGVGVFRFEDLAWQQTAEPGLRLKPVRYDNEGGHYLGWVSFAPMARSGLHQHRGVATSFVVDGGLTDYHGSLGLHEAGINLHGATHDAVSYQSSVLVSRLEGPVAYPHEHGELSGLHAGSRHDEVVNPAPDVPPEVNVKVDALPAWETGIASVRRQTIFDYAGTGSTHRFAQLQLGPGADLPPWRASARVELWVRGGRLGVQGQVVLANSFVVIEPGAEVRLATPHGALVLAWAEGPEHWLTPADGPRAVRSSLFGF